MASTITMYADTTSGILFADTASNRIEVIFTYTAAGYITSFTPKTYAGPLEIPSILGGVNVTTIGFQAFRECSNLTSITIPASVTNIDSTAFVSCSKLATVTFASGSQLQTIGQAAFNSCVELTSIIIPASVISIGVDAFSSCLKLDSVTFASGSLLTTIGNNAFTTCTKLESITIPNSVTTIATNAFTNSGLTNVNISQVFLTSNGLPAGSNQPFYGKSSGVKIVGYKLFKSTGELTGATALLNGATLAIIEGYSSIGANAFKNAASLTSITIPVSVTSIGDKAFDGCSNLVSINIPASVQTILLYTFRGCVSLNSIHIPASVTFIYNGAFGYCNSLASISVDSSNQNYSSVNGVLYNLNATALICYPIGKSGSTFTIPASVTSIDGNAFDSCTGLTAITIPASVTSIGATAFSGCSNLTSVTFASDSQLLTIGLRAFQYCSNLTSITIPASVTSIGENAFNSSGLTSVIFASGSQLLTIGNTAFSNCSGLTSITIPASVTTIGIQAFNQCTGLTTIAIPASVTSIGWGVFRYCSKLTAISVDPNNQNYSSTDGVLYDELIHTLICYPIKKPGSTFTIPNTVRTIDQYAFGSSSLTSIAIPDSVTSIGVMAFTNCINLAGITIPASVTSIGADAFQGSGLFLMLVSRINGLGLTASSPTFPYGKSFTIEVIIISLSAKFDADSLGNLTPNDATGIITITYTDVGSLTGFLPKEYIGPLKIPSTLGGVAVTSIGVTAFVVNAFVGCAGLTSIIIPTSVTTIGYGAFSNCTSLETVTFASGSQLLTIDLNAFTTCAKLTSITIPNSVTTIAINAFTNSGLTNVNVSQGFLASKGLPAGSNQPFYGKSSGVTIVGYKLFKSTGELTGATAQLNGATLAIIEGYSSIGANAFLNATSLTSITISDSVTTIGNQAFYVCAGLTSITIPASVTSIGWGVFNYCNSLASINVNQSNENFLSVGGVLYDKLVHALISYPHGKSGSTFIIPSSVKTIVKSAFNGCTGLKSIVIPASVTSIGDIAFMNCISLRSIAIPALVTSIGENAFQGSGLITMYVYAQNQLGLTPGTSVTQYGKSFTVIDIAAPPPTIPICFLVGTKVTTDQGDIAVEKLNPKIHTILGKKIVSITKSAPLKKIFYKGKGVNAIDLVEDYQGAPENNGELLHIVRIKK